MRFVGEQPHSLRLFVGDVFSMLFFKFHPPDVPTNAIAV